MKCHIGHSPYFLGRNIAMSNTSQGGLFRSHFRDNPRTRSETLVLPRQHEGLLTYKVYPLQIVRRMIEFVDTIHRTYSAVDVRMDMTVLGETTADGKGLRETSVE